MSQFINFGTGSAGTLTVSTPTTSSPTEYTLAVTSGSTSATLGSAYGGSNGDSVFLYQARGTNAGTLQHNYIVSGAGSTSVTLLLPADATFATSGGNAAFLQILPEYSGITISSTLTAKAFTGSVGGLVGFLCNGLTDISGSIVGTAKGFRGGDGQDHLLDNPGWAGEGSAGATVRQRTANGNAGGGGQDKGGRCGGGGGGSYGSAGTDGAASSEGNDNGSAGSTVGTSAMSLVFMGGGGGGGGCSDGSNVGGDGGNGGAAIVIFSRQLTISGSITTNGDNGANGAVGDGSGDGGGGGGGAGGGFLAYSAEPIIGTDKISTTGGTGGTQSGFGGNGGNGGKGRIAINSCSLSGSVGSSLYGSYETTTGGQDFCSSGALIY